MFPILAIPTLGVKILTVFKAQPKKSENYDRFNLVLIGSININM